MKLSNLAAAERQASPDAKRRRALAADRRSRLDDRARLGLGDTAASSKGRMKRTICLLACVALLAPVDGSIRSAPLLRRRVPAVLHDTNAALVGIADGSNSSASTDKDDWYARYRDHHVASTTTRGHLRGRNLVSEDDIINAYAKSYASEIAAVITTAAGDAGDNESSSFGLAHIIGGFILWAGLAVFFAAALQMMATISADVDGLESHEHDEDDDEEDDEDYDDENAESVDEDAAAPSRGTTSNPDLVRQG